MKKIFVLFLAIFAMAYFSIPAFATGSAAKSAYQGGIPGSANCIDLSTTSTPDCTDTNNEALVGLSASVTASYVSDGTTYAADTYNPKGTGKEYGVASDSTVIKYNDQTGTADTAPTADNSTAFDGWDQLGG